MRGITQDGCPAGDKWVLRPPESSQRLPTLQAYAVNLIDGITQTDIFEKFASSECIPLEFVKTEIKFEKAVLQHSLILNVCKARLL